MSWGDFDDGWGSEYYNSDGWGVEDDDSDNGFDFQVDFLHDWDFPDDFDNGFDSRYDFDPGFGSRYVFDNGFGSQDDSGDEFGLQDESRVEFSPIYYESSEECSDESSEGFIIQDVFSEEISGAIHDDESTDEWFGLQDDCVSDDLVGLFDDFDNGFSLHDENFGTHLCLGGIVEREAKAVETSSVFLQQEKAKRIKRYFSTHKILLVGEGDFSFSACLAESFGSAANMVATSVDSYDFILRNYGSRGWLNLSSLEKKGCKVIHEVDATNMSYHSEVGSMAFDIIVFNFPHAGFIKFESRINQIERHRNLVKSFFENAKRMLSIGGEIHVVHKTNGFFREWRIEELAAQCGLRIIEKTAFNLSDYPGYETKYGFGGNKNFDCHPSMTYKFAPSFKGLSNRPSWAAPWDDWIWTSESL